MSQFDSIISSLKTESYPVRKQLLEYLLQVIRNLSKSKKPLSGADRTALLDYAFGAVEELLAAIPAAETYREKDQIFECENQLIGLIIHLCPDSSTIPPEKLDPIRTLVKVVSDERYIETAIDELFKQEHITAGDIHTLLSSVNRTSDEYHKGTLYAGLIHYKDAFPRLSGEAAELITGHLKTEFIRYLAKENLCDDCVNNMELAADIVQFFADDTLLTLLRDIMALGYPNVNYYAVDTLLSLNQEVPSGVIPALAQDLEYACLTYHMLGRFGAQSLFPDRYATEEYLAMSDLVHWLIYPTELGKAPDQIEYVGKVSYPLRKEFYHIFRYCSDSDNLDQSLKNKWLIGWSSPDGGPFSNFDEYALYEKGTVASTLRNIKQKLLR